MALRSNATIGQIARAAGVGTGTVSRVLNDARHVRPATRERVLDVMRRLHYRPHAGARTLARNASKTLAFVMANRRSMHLYNVTTLNGVMAASAEEGYSVLYTHFEYTARTRPTQIALPPIALERGAIDGLILVGINHPNLLERLADLRIPFVLHQSGYTGEVDEIRGGDAVAMDDRAGTETAATHLITLGHRRITFVGDLEMPWFRRRYAGYLRAMNHAGLTTRLQWVAADGDNFDAGIRSAERLLRDRSRSTAVLAGDDLVMLGVLETLRRSHLGVPEDMSLIGFGDTQEIRYQQQPPLSTIRAPRFQIGQQMVSMLVSRLADPHLVPRSVTLPTHLVLRDSCGPPRVA